ncbi:persephin [Pygocentrus nattereri]|uniref:persephin n=1 Tax=Pygocentrus nattereri TaxID=42514 RepID=UPI0018919D89|nr:persephin [Pygocentrus nattereri]
MWSLLKLTMLLVCIRVGQAHWLRTLLESGDQRPGLPEEPGKGGEGGEQEEGAVRPRRSAEGPCGLHSILLQVRDLGLGYDSDEVVLFKYCSGFCPRLTSNHDLTLANLQQSGALPHAATPGHHAPCCRPTHHEDMAFLDNAHRWHRVEKLSASACTCMG